MTVVIQDGRISAVGADRHVSIPRGARTPDVRGLAVFPGLIDCHVHLCLGADADVVRTIEQEPAALTSLRPRNSRDERWKADSPRCATWGVAITRFSL